MIVGVREFFRTSAGKYAAIVLVVIALSLCVWSIMTNLGGDYAYHVSRGRVFICAETKEPYNVELDPSMKIPHHSPHSGKATGYPAELCYWTKDGKAKDEPTPVLMNSYVKQPEPTFCPDCQRLVTIRNAYPEPGASPPPTQDEFKARNSRGTQEVAL